MKEEINKRIAEYDDEINKLQYEIEKVKFEKRRFLVDNEGVLLGEKISRYEKKHFITYWNIESLVLKGESYEEWFKRVGSRCYGYTGKKANKKLWDPIVTGKQDFQCSNM